MRPHDWVVFDIETAINERAFEDLLQKEFEPDPKLASADQPPKSITTLKTVELREARLAEWQEEQAAKIERSIDRQRQKAIDRAALHWWEGRVVGIAAVDLNSEETFAMAGDDEVPILTAFVRYMSNLGGKVLVGKRSTTFDVPFLIGRYMAHDLGVPGFLKIGSRLHDAKNLDVDWIFGNHRHDLTPSLAKIAYGLGIDGKLGEGSQVADLVREGKWDELREYNAQDVRITAEVLRRFAKEFEEPRTEPLPESEIPFS